VCNDLLGMDDRFKPRFVKRFAELESPVIAAVKAYVDEVRGGTFPGPEHSFRGKNARRKVARLY